MIAAAVSVLFTWQAAATFALMLISTYFALKAAIRRPMELAKDHWSRNPDKCVSKPSSKRYSLEQDWVYQNSKKTSDLVWF